MGIKNFNSKQYELVLEVITDEIVTLSNGDWSKLDVCILVSKYSEKYGLSDFAGYIQFCKDNPEYDQTTTTLIYDLMEFHRGSIGFSPRSTGYAKYLKCENTIPPEERSTGTDHPFLCGTCNTEYDYENEAK
jgi:hypothetical protein